MKSRTVAAVLLVWLAVSAAAVAGGALARVPPPAIVLGLSIVVLVVTLSVEGLREWARAVDLRLFVLPHLVRFVGAVFLVMVARGALSPAFTPIGWGDFASAAGAAVLLIVGAPTERSSRWMLWLGWNVFGMADMILLVITGIRLAQSAPEQFTIFRSLPFGLLPTFAVPLIVATHVLIFWRLFAMPARLRVK